MLGGEKVGTSFPSPWLKGCRACAHLDLQLQAVLFHLLAQQAPYSQPGVLPGAHAADTWHTYLTS